MAGLVFNVSDGDNDDQGLPVAHCTRCGNPFSKGPFDVERSAKRTIGGGNEKDNGP